MKRKKVLIVNPWVTDFSLYDFWIKPLGILIIASILKNKGFEIHILDLLDRHNPFFLEKLDEKDRKKIKDKKYSTGKFLSKEIEKPFLYKNIKRKYKIYGIYPEIAKKYLKKFRNIDYILITSGMTYWYPGLENTISFLKNIFKDSLFILGGRYTFLCKNHALNKFKDVNIITEIDLKKIFKKLKEITAGEIDEDFDLNKINIFDTYLDYPNLRHFAVITSFGCPFKCIYCASKILFPEFKSLNINNLIEGIEKIHKLKKPSDLAFYDDALLYPPERAKEIFIKMIERNIKLRMHTPNAVHARFIDTEIAKLMRKLNFKTIRIGFETIDEDKLKRNWSFKSDIRLFEKAVDALRKAGFENEIGAYVLIGTEEDKIDDLMRSYEYLYNKKIKIYPAQFSPVPLTPFHRENSDPLLTNKSIYPSGNKEIGFEKYEKIKDFAKILNRNIKKDKRCMD